MAACALCGGPMAPDALSDRHPGCAASWPGTEDGEPEAAVCGSVCPRIHAVPPLICNKPKGHRGDHEEAGRSSIIWNQWGDT